MSPRTENSNVVGFQELTPPGRVKAAVAATPEVEAQVLETRRQIRDVLTGVDDRRLVVVVGPCSIHDPDAALDYAQRLAKLRRELSEQLVVLMRTYFEKPRTTVGWKGLINDPHLDGTRDIELGLKTAREVLLAVNRAGVPCATEALDPITPQYLSDLISWASIGARTTESQTHREMASGLSMPVGFKNGTDGSLGSAINALISAGHGHSFLGINADGHASVVKTTGNPNRHVVLRGGARPNYYREDVEQAVQQVAKADSSLKRPVMVDTSHGNSSKDYRRQGTVCRDVVDQFVGGQSGLFGLLIESNLEEGRQDWMQGANLRYGTSITDACIGWSETEALLIQVAERVRSRQAAA
jgi:3-deoxy-7-phosphoheptulonate synthase